MATQVTPPRGMRDFLPAEKAGREHALGVIRRSFAAHGFDEIETPVMEDSARLHSGLGGDNEKLGFAVLKRGLAPADALAAAESGDLLGLADLGLRFDLTVPLARFYATHRAALPTVFRAIQIAPVWRAERPQKGRYRQFVQCDIDIIGEAGPLAEIELITATMAALDALGLAGCSVRINDRRILTALLAYWQVPSDLFERALITIDKLDKIGVDGVVTELDGLGIPTDGIAETLRSIASAGWDLLGSASEPDASAGSSLARTGRLRRPASPPRRAPRGRPGLRSDPRARHGLLHRNDLRDRAPRSRLLTRRRRALRRHDRPVPRRRRTRVRLLDRLRTHRRPARRHRRIRRERRRAHPREGRSARPPRRPEDRARRGGFARAARTPHQKPQGPARSCRRGGLWALRLCHR
ncbi:ATP phosphoribosyltransferase regulatory subunit [Cryobacterium breve]|uniref:Histidyl-tRNA synthetase n=1 Tax=Cryobacterium breve TaxID=1259258 RepID=A0ABY7NAW4_9MICO|nr:ATP phosphoribosyltransferase regulatory subunit [Cryobacterium breve]